MGWTGRTDPGRTVGRSLAVVVGVVMLAGCGSATPADDAPATVEPSATRTSSVEPEVTTSPPPVVPTDLTDEVFLPDGVVNGANPGTRPVEEDTWQLPRACGALALPAQATAVGGTFYGDGATETAVGVHQVAVMADADAAAVVADEVAAAFEGCVPEAGQTGAYAVEDVAVGAQGRGLASSYYGEEVGVVDDGDLGTYLVVTRRGNAVALVGLVAGEWNIGTARTDSTALAQQAWERLCRYDSSGC